jgi:hypothetical protein
MKKDINDLTGAEAAALFEEAEAGPDLAAPAADNGWPKPLPLGKTEEPPPFPTPLFPPWLEDMTREATRSLEVPADLPGLCALGVLATCFQKRFKAVVHTGYSEPLSLFLAVGLEPGGRKSTVFSLFMKPVDEFENRELTRLTPEINDAMGKHSLLTKQITFLEGKLASGAKGITHRADLDSCRKDLAALKIPVPPRLHAMDATPEALSRLMIEQGGRMTIASAEGAFLEILKGRYSDTPAIEICLQGHAGDALRIDRAAKDKTPVNLQTPALSLALCVQPGLIETFCRNNALAGRGLLSRIVFALPKSTLGFRSHNEAPISDDVSDAYFNKIMEFLCRPEKRHEVTGEIQAEEIFCDDATQAALRAFKQRHESSLKEGGAMRDSAGFLSGFAGKLGGLAVRVAALLALADGKDVVSADYFEKGERFAEYAATNARLVAGLVAEDPARKLAKRILSWIKRRRQPVFARRDATRDMDKQEDLEAALALLEEHDYIKSKQDASAAPRAGRKPGPSYEVNPAVFENCR